MHDTSEEGTGNPTFTPTPNQSTEKVNTFSQSFEEGTANPAYSQSSEKVNADPDIIPVVNNSDINKSVDSDSKPVVSMNSQPYIGGSRPGIYSGFKAKHGKAVGSFQIIIGILTMGVHIAGIYVNKGIDHAWRAHGYYYYYGPKKDRNIMYSMGYGIFCGATVSASAISLDNTYRKRNIVKIAESGTHFLRMVFFFFFFFLWCFQAALPS